MKPWIGISIATLIAFSLIAVIVVVPMVTVVGIAPLDLPPDALTLKAREIAVAFGYTQKPMNWARGFASDGDARRYIQSDVPVPERWPTVASGQPNLLYFWYRQSPRYLEPFGRTVQPRDPPEDVTGMVRVSLDARGHMTAFSAVPPQVDETPPGAVPDWKAVLNAAGFDPAKVSETQPQWTPPMMADARMAWTATLPDAPKIQVRLEAAAWHGKPVYFAMVAPWTRAARMQPFQQSTGTKVTQFAVIGIACLALIGASLLSRRNVKRGRGDLAGATRLAVFSGSVMFAIWLLRGWHLPTAWEVGALFEMIAYSLLIAGGVWVGYVAIEPYVRRHWPQAIVSWTRLLAGGWRDPLVGRDLLFGIATGFVWTFAWAGSILAERSYGLLPSSNTLLHPLMGARYTAATALIALSNVLLQLLVTFFVLFVLRAVLRREWLSGAAFVLLFTLLDAGSSTVRQIDLPISLVVSITVYLVVTRLGFVSLLAGLYVQFFFSAFPITSDFSSWYSGCTMFALLLIGGLSAFAAYTALAGTSIIKDELL